MLGNTMFSKLFSTHIYSMDDNNSQSCTNLESLTSLFSTNSIDELELDINNFCKKNEFSYKKEQCSDRIISILSIFNNEILIKNKDLLQELISLILKNLINQNFKLQDSNINPKFLKIFTITIDLLVNDKIPKPCINLYYQFYKLMLFSFIQQGSKNEDDKAAKYSIFFEFMMQNTSWQKLANIVTDFIIKNHHLKESNKNIEIDPSDEERFVNMITFADQIIYANDNYYNLLKTYKDSFYSKDKGITNLGILLLTAINRANLIDNNTYKFFENTIKNKIDQENPDLKTGNYNTKTFTSYLHILLCIRALISQPVY